VFTRAEVQLILRNLEGTKWLMASLLQGAVWLFPNVGTFVKE
jgi:hypothetical protein